MAAIPPITNDDILRYFDSSTTFLTYTGAYHDVIDDYSYDLIKELTDSDYIRRKHNTFISFDSIKRRRDYRSSRKHSTAVHMNRHSIIKQPAHRISALTIMYRNIN